jgi:aminoglycoside phosphotransferase family enzyme/predicted kinase
MVAEALRQPECYPHPVDPRGVGIVETHISWIFLTGSFAYKLKKPVDLGFLDFSTLERRRSCCYEELRLNRRLCPDLYLDVLPVTAQEGTCRVGGDGTIVDYVVRMVQFDRTMELDRLLAAEALTPAIVDQIAGIVSAFHLAAPHAATDTPQGTPDVLLVPMLENLDRTGKIVHSPDETAAMEQIRAWTLEEHRRRTALMQERKASGSIRECHGDMHTGNMVLRNGKVDIFDCIEFNPNLSVIDIISDAAFLFMDLQHAGRNDLAWRFLNGWLAVTGDFPSLRLLRLYCTYRAMVRAKVTAIRLSQEEDESGRRQILKEHRSYLALASSYVHSTKPMLILTHGVSGTGKSFISARLADAPGCLHLRSDIERKRLFGISPYESSRSSGHDIYTSDASERTYRALLEAADAALSGGWPVIVDATFLKERQRRPFIELADSCGAACRILVLSAPEAVLRERVRARLEAGGDPSEADIAVLESQLRTVEPPYGNEKALCIDIDTQGPADMTNLLEQLAC